MKVYQIEVLDYSGNTAGREIYSNFKKSYLEGRKIIDSMWFKYVSLTEYEVDYCNKYDYHNAKWRDLLLDYIIEDEDDFELIESGKIRDGLSKHETRNGYCCYNVNNTLACFREKHGFATKD